MSDSTQITTASLLKDIRQEFGFIPPFFNAVKANTSLLHSLWRHTRAAYIENPLPALFKEKLFLYLSYVCRIPYDLHYHCVRLHTNYGLNENEILALLTMPVPTAQEITLQIKQLQTIAGRFDAWPPKDATLEMRFFSCVAYLFTQKQKAAYCRRELQRLLGRHYIFLTALLNYIYACHSWIQADVETGKEEVRQDISSFIKHFGEGSQLHTLLKEQALQIKREQQQGEQHRTEAETISPQLMQEINQRISDFLGITAHELKTPITTIKGTIQILLRTTKREIQKTGITLEEHKNTIESLQRLLIRADNQVRRLTHLINDIVYISRIQDQRLDLKLERHNLTVIIQEAVNQQSQLFPSRTIKFAEQQDELFVLLDRDHIEQVITNYLSNALKYSASDKPVEVEIRPEDTKIHVLVQDFGPGIAEVDQEHIWERFYRVQRTEVVSGSAIGFGIGLYISRSIIEKHGGSVGLKSKPGEGSTFWFTLNNQDEAASTQD